MRRLSWVFVFLLALTSAQGVADSGKSIILISSDMQEMVALADRIAVFRDFTVVDSFENDRSYDGSSRRIMGSIQSAAANNSAR